MSDLSEKLRPFAFHGVLFGNPHNDEALGDCPFCGRERKFSVNVTTGQWRCWSCETGTAKGGGNVYTFLAKLHEMGVAGTRDVDYNELSADRGYRYPETLAEWGLCRSPITGEWLVPTYNLERRITNLYRYVLVEGKLRLLPTPTLGHHLFGVNLYDKDKETVYLCEGPWDAIALYELFGQTKTDGRDYKPTANREISLLGVSNVLAVPGCNVFQPSWVSLFGSRAVVLMYDNDHERQHPVTGQVIQPAGLRGMQQVARIFAEASDKPSTLSYLCWDKNGFNTQLPNGFDVRDAISPRKVGLCQSLPVQQQWRQL